MLIKTKWEWEYTLLILFKSVHPPALNASRFLLERQWMFAMVVYKLISCPQFEKMDLKTIVTVGCFKTNSIFRTWIIFLKNNKPFNFGKTNDSYTTITKQKKLWPIQLLFCLRNYMWTSVVWNSLFRSAQHYNAFFMIHIYIYIGIWLPLCKYSNSNSDWSLGDDF